MPRKVRRRARALLRRLRKSDGAAAVEFALVLPVALLIMSLVVYGGQVYGVQRKVTLAASTVADIFAQGNNTGSATITAAQLDQILAYPNLILYPNDPAGVQVVVSQLSVTTGSGGTTGAVIGSWANANGTPRTIGETMSVDPAIAAAFAGASKSTVVLAEVYYPFQPTSLYVALPQMTLHDSVMMIPRTAAKITVD